VCVCSVREIVPRTGLLVSLARAGCSSAAVPPACLARGTSCPVYFQGVAMKPGCLSGAGILLHNNLAGSRSARYTLIW